MNKQHAKTAHPTKAGPGRYHKDGEAHGTLASNARHGKHVPRIIGMRTGLTDKDLQPQRLDGEAYEAYRQRRAHVNRLLAG